MIESADDLESSTGSSPSLAAEFSQANRAQWLELVAEVLNGAPFERLVSKTSDGISIEPLYDADPVAVPVPGRPPARPWRILQRIEHPDPAAAHAQAREDLDNGATGLSFVLADAIGSYGFGVDAEAAALAHVLDGMLPAARWSLDLQSGAAAEALADAIRRAVGEASAAPDDIDLRFGIDPLGALATGRSSGTDVSDAGARLAAVVGRLMTQGFRGPFAVADGRVIHNAGGSEAQELAYALSAALWSLRALESGGLALEDARRLIYFRLAADADQFLTTAKFRAVRRLWARVEQACGLDSRPAFVAAETAWRMMTRCDPAMNIVRATVAVAAAGFGGADAITVLPHTAAVGLPDRSARRLARNTQLVLIEEANLARVSDPAAGSGAIETLTGRLCETAWDIFQEIEKEGGAAAALANRMIQVKVAAVRAVRERAIAHRHDVLVGTTEFADLAEAPIAVLAPMPRADPRSNENEGPLARDASGQDIALPCSRLAEPFEVLRDASNRYAEKTGALPRIFLGRLGQPADFTARATYAADFFAAGGIQALDSGGFLRPGALVSAFSASGAVLACLCSSDALYESDGAAAARGLKAIGVRHVYLAGRPGAREAAYRAAGVDTFIHVGCDVLATLRAAHRLLGISLTGDAT